MTLFDVKLSNYQITKKPTIRQLDVLKKKQENALLVVYCRKIENKFGKQIVIQKLLLYLHEFVFSYIWIIKIVF